MNMNEIEYVFIANPRKLKLKQNDNFSVGLTPHCDQIQSQKSKSLEIACFPPSTPVFYEISGTTRANS